MGGVCGTEVGGGGQDNYPVRRLWTIAGGRGGHPALGQESCSLSLVIMYDTVGCFSMALLRQRLTQMMACQFETLQCMSTLTTYTTIGTG